MLSWFRKRAAAPPATPDSSADPHPDPEDLRARARELLSAQRFEDAVAMYQALAAAQPADAGILSALAYALRSAHRSGAAKEALQKAIALDPGRAEPYYMLAELLRDEGDARGAAQAMQAAIARAPEFHFAYPALIELLLAIDAREEARAACARALALMPDAARLHVLSANIASLDQDDSAALASQQRALALAPGDVSIHIGMGLAMQRLGRHEEGLRAFATAIELDPSRADSRWAWVMGHLPSAISPVLDTADFAPAFLDALAAFDAWSATASFDESTIVGAYLPFMLAYREENHRALLAAYGAVCARLMARWQSRQAWASRATPRRPAAAKLRIGIASPFFCNHSVWHAILKGWVEAFDRERFELYAFHLSSHDDHETRWARSRVTVFEAGTRRLSQWAEHIARAELDALVFGSIGMDETSSQLACLRLAPVQATTWGHPETSGLPTLDYYLSAELLEPAHAQEAYSETLIALPHLGTYYAPTPSDPGVTLDLAAYGVDARRPILVCPGTPFKYAPQHDRVLVQIATRLPACQLLFFRSNFTFMSRHFEERLAAQFTRAGLSLSHHCRFLPWLSSAQFHSVLRQADLFIDTIGFSGFNTASQALQCGLPVATREGRFMRGRLASALLKRLELSELVAPDEGALVELIVRLASDPRALARTRDRIAASCSRLFYDTTPVRALEAFLERAIATRRQA